MRFWIWNRKEKAGPLKIKELISVIDRDGRDFIPEDVRDCVVKHVQAWDGKDPGLCLFGREKTNFQRVINDGTG